MAWVHQKNTKPKRKDPTETIESTRSLLLFLSGRPPPKSITQIMHKPLPSPPLPNIHIEPKPPSRHHHEHSYEDDRSSRHHYEIVEHHEPEPDANAHAFSFSRDRLVPIVPKHPPARRVVSERVEFHQRRITPRTTTQCSRDPSPPPPPRPRAKTRSAVSDGPRLPRHYIAPDTSSRIVSPMWASATTPLRM